jgi:hypothetical protein
MSGIGKPAMRSYFKDDRSRAWVEHLRCANCGKTRTARLSEADGWTVRVDILPEGFYFIQSKGSSNFYCSSCDGLAEL